MDEFTVSCGRCVKGKVPSPKTGNPINCRTCRGTGERTRRQWSYTADFRIIWDEGHEDIVDVKGWANERLDRKSTRLNSSHVAISYAVFCLKKKKKTHR